MRHFKPQLTLRLPADMLPRLNAQAERFPYTTPHALGLHLLQAGLLAAEAEHAKLTSKPKKGTK